MGHSYRVRIGIREVTAMEPNTILGDQEVRGFVARRQHSDIVTFSVVYRTKDGTQRWQKLERFPILTPHLARQEAIKILRAKALGLDPSGERMALRGGATVAELLDQYLADMDSHKLNGKKETTKKSDKSRIENHIRPRLGKVRVAAITQAQIEDFMNSCSPGSAKRIMQLLSAIFTFAIQRKLRSDNPCKGIVRPKTVHKTRRLSVAEYQQLGAALNDSVANDVFLFLAVSGWRTSEARFLKWSELDIERRIASLSDSKTGPSIRPLSSATIDIIKRQKQIGEYVFALQGKPFYNIHHLWRALGLAKDITQHTLRHSFASLAGDLGLADSTIARLLGHRQNSITSRYIHMEKSVIEASDLVAQETLKLMRSYTQSLIMLPT
jgi:integrase